MVKELHSELDDRVKDMHEPLGLAEVGDAGDAGEELSPLEVDCKIDDVAFAQPNGWFDVQRIVRSRQVDGTTFYLVHWKNSWVAHDDISQAALNSFHRRKRRRN
jgi:hypothetical protein